MEVLHNPSSSLCLPHPLSPSSAIARPTSSFTPISSAVPPLTASSDRPLQSCTPSGYGLSLKAPPSAENPLPSSRAIARTLLSHTNLCAENPPPSSSRSPFQKGSSQKKTLFVLRSNAAAGYAAALAEIGQSKHILDLIYADLKKLRAFLQHKQLHSFLLNPSIHDKHKKNICARLADDHAFVPYTVKLLNLVIDKKRACLLRDVIKEFEVIYNKMVETDVAVVLSATKIAGMKLADTAKTIHGIPSSKDDVWMKNVLDSAFVALHNVKHGKNGSQLNTDVKAWQDLATV